MGSGLAQMLMVYTLSTREQSIWSAGLFQLDQSRSWKVYLATTIALTFGVFAVWLSYLKWSGVRREERPLHIAGVGYVREGRVVPSHLPRRDEPSLDFRRETSWNQ